MYTYGDLESDLSKLGKKGFEIGSIGQSVRGRPIYSVFVGDKSLRPVIVTGGIHARENIGVKIIMNHIFREDFSGCAVYFVPMVNPDGNILCSEGNSTHFFGFEPLDALKEKGFDFRLFKANYRCVDLNVNFDAKWGSGYFNTRKPDYENYIGPYAESEPETEALVRFTESVRPAGTISYHAMGREIYWYFYQREFFDRDERIAKRIAEHVDYSLVMGANASAGGYKDKCVEKYLIPSLTIELGWGSHPLPDDAAEKEYGRVKSLVQLFYKEVIQAE